MQTQCTYGLIGKTLGHSFSKKLFDERIRPSYPNSSYHLWELDSIDDLDHLMETVPSLRGFNVTIPYKSSVIDKLDYIDPEALSIGAVNCVKVDDKLSGYNTDIEGFVQTIAPLLKKAHKNALVLGTGGASKAIVAGLCRLGITPTVVSRTPGINKIGYHELTEEIIGENTVIVNCTPLGMWPNTEGSPDIPYRMISARHLCYDVVYNPAETKFLNYCKAQGATVCNGMAMLIQQAVESWKIWDLES